MTAVLIILGVIGIGAFVYFVVLHKHVSAIHAKVDSILHAVSPGGSAAVPKPSPPAASSIPLSSVLKGQPKPLT